MAAMSDYLELKVLDHVLGTAAFTAPGTVYLAAYTSDPGETNTGNEVSGANYARQAAAFSAAAAGTTSNSSTISFPAAGVGGWGTITHFALFDALTAGNMLIYGALNASKAIAENDVLQFAASDLDITAA